VPKIDMLAQFFEVSKPKKTAKKESPKKEVKKRQPKKPAPKKKQVQQKPYHPQSPDAGTEADKHAGFGKKKEKPKVNTVYHYDGTGKRTVIRRDRKVRRIEKVLPPPPPPKKRKPRKWKPILAKEVGEKTFSEIRKIAKKFQKRSDELDKVARSIAKQVIPHVNTKTLERIRGMFFGNSVAFYIQEYHNNALVEQVQKAEKAATVKAEEGGKAS